MKKLLKTISAKLGYQTEKKLILLMSDDWGSLRLKSKQSRERLKDLDVLGNNRFDQYDALETNQDLEELFNVLIKYKDYKGNHPIITAVTNLGNPDFKRIQASDFKNYEFETIAETYDRYQDSNRVLELIKQGQNKNIFVPELHGREHLKWNWWLEDLQNKNSNTRKAFEEEFFFLPPAKIQSNYRAYGAAFDVMNTKDETLNLETLKSSVTIFQELFSKTPNSFTPPAISFSNHLERRVSGEGIKYLDVPRFFKMPKPNGKTTLRFFILGKQKYGLRHLVRNTVFETNMSETNNGVEDCLKGIEEAFQLKQPAIISNHRASFVGRIDPKNREKGLRALDELLKQILKKWPEVEFISVKDL
ncbi:hypothetical protein SAMN05444278_103256 [Psychroflexus salarius]|uniref:Uncharacterized protein n=1 Tax=Psychroflexus salarius TaxID=1155689 RepID=A0A1M4V5J6_9FLAO|nr:hypothetical protein [Psychroflexus salarius]SHE64215.1 hypothetical protein SAMN05444278_103256 [Psychroflexus salarius]